MNRQSAAIYPQVTDLGDNIVEINYGPHAAVTLDAIQDALRQHLAMQLPGKQGVLVVADRAVRADRDAQRFASSDVVCAHTCATALLADSFTSLHLARMFLWFFPPPYPSRIFQDRKQALGWLAEQVAINSVTS